MKILIYTNIIPSEQDEGGKVAQFVFLNQALKNGYDVTLVSSGSSQKLESLESLRNQIKGLKTHLIQEPSGAQSNSFFKKIVGIIEWEFTKWLNKNKKNNILQGPFFTNPVNKRSEFFLREWTRIIDSTSPDIIQVDFVDNADLAIIDTPKIKKVIIVHDLRFASITQILQHDNLSLSYTKYLTAFFRTSEIAYLNNFEGILLFSDDDRNKLINYIQKDKLFASPFGIKDDFFVDLKSEYKIKKLVFVGPDHHPPNLDAIYFYAENLAEIVYSQFGLKLEVIGKWSDENKLRFQKHEGIKFLGFVEDLTFAMNDSLLIVPLRIGSGIRTKIIEAFAQGVPVISTAIGCEGIGVTHLRELLIVDEIMDFVAAIQTLLGNSDDLEDMRLRARHFAETNFSSLTCFERRISIYRELLLN